MRQPEAERPPAMMEMKRAAAPLEAAAALFHARCRRQKAAETEKIRRKKEKRLSQEKQRRIRIAGIVRESIVDGPGLRFVVFTQGCPHRCPGCQNPQTHDFEGGQLVDISQLVELMEKNPLLKGITFSGGEPFAQPEAMAALAEEVKAHSWDLLIYSGYTFEQLMKMGETRPAVRRLLELGDVLVDGPYLEAQRSLELKFRGSRNQRVIDLPASLAAGKAVLSPVGEK